MSRSGIERVRKEAGDADGFLAAVGAAVRAARAQRGMTRKILARDSGVSERYLAKLETGDGNASLLVLRDIAGAMDIPLHDLIAGEESHPACREILALARGLSPESLARLAVELKERFAGETGADKGCRFSLIGLRGAGKSTLGPLLAERLGFGFVELNRRVEKAFGAGLDEIFSLGGQPSFRRLERRCLAEIIAKEDRVVIATGGSIVADEETLSLLLRRTHVIWLQARPEEHMARVVAQGDMRPMAGNREAMADLKQILAARTSLYSRADAFCDTSGQTVEVSLDRLTGVAQGLLASTAK
ncbi:MAG: transcriptional regulator [Sneathiella sp.]|jgi:XRE family aerobic/anaerobic benzoate catabolism transcriptional regulator|uniref:helix-turn-helix transcriptional regulator n=1 Tax=Sneathiella sp. TaxID=1964365 RepID=UPI000C4D3734|nr:helix-turn-helix transcriptional regulator [Sneathiella sp.]MAL77645.1 transcriptional regulator [Sneathiella sp.]